MPVVDPTREQFKALMQLDPETGPVHMLNMLCFRAQADYGDRSDAAPCSGREAYQRYGEAIADILAEVGGKPVWMADAQLSLIAPEGEQWDECLLVEYPNLAAFQRMISNDDYQAQTFHRTAALHEARLIITTAQMGPL